MITAVCMNPCIDRSISISDFKYGATNRAADVRNDAGGKGINVAVTAAQLGAEVVCLSPLYKNGGSAITEKLRAFGVKSEGVLIDGTLRTNLKLIDRASGIVTEVNESGAPIDAAGLAQMTELIEQYARKSELLILSGSLPPNCPADYYRSIIERADALGCRCILDADGEKLREGLKAHPFLVKPNRSELEGLLGQPLQSISEVRNAALSLISRGVSIAAVSLGADGALITDGMQSFYAPCMNVDVRSTVGAGDAMIAALAVGCCKNLPLDEIFRMGVAGASASVMTEGTQPPDRKVFSDLIGQVDVHAV